MSKKKVIKRSYPLSFINLPRKTYIQVFSLAFILTALIYTSQLVSTSQDTRSRASSGQQFKRGDLNHDGVIDGTDVEILKSKFGSYDREADLNGDGKIDEVDLNIELRLLGK